MINRKPSVTYDTVTGWDPEQIAQDHFNMLLDDYNQGLLESYLSVIESDCPEINIEKYYDNN